MTAMEKQHYWNDIFNTIPDMITIHDGDFNIIYANKSAKEMLNLPSSLKGCKVKCFSYYHGTGSPPDGCPSCKCIKTKKPAVFEVFEPHLNKHIEIRAIPRLDKNKKLIGLIHIVRDITKRKKIEDSIKRAEEELRVQANDLIEANAAFKVLLKHREDDKSALEIKVLYNIDYLVKPYIEKLKGHLSGSEWLGYLELLEKNLDNLVSPFSQTLSSTKFNFTPREIRIAGLVKKGRQDQEIADILNVSLDTVKTHRQNIRKKLGICGKKENLRTYLLSLEK